MLFSRKRKYWQGANAGLARLLQKGLTMSEGMLGLLSLSDVQGPRNDFDEKLAGPEGKDWLREFKRFLRKEKTWEAVTAPDLKVFKTIKLGTGLRTADDFSRALAENGYGVSDWAKDILGKPEFMVASREIEVDLVVLTTAQLTGNSQGGTTAEVFAGAKRIGLDKCSAEVGPQLRLQYKDQPKVEWLLVGMDPIAGSHGYPDVFNVGHDGKDLWLYAFYGNPENRWAADSRWVFLRRK